MGGREEMGGREKEKTLTKTFFSVVSAQPTAAGCSGVISTVILSQTCVNVLLSHWLISLVSKKII